MNSIKKIFAVVLAIMSILVIPGGRSGVYAAEGSGAGEFVTRLYNFALNRNPDSEGYDIWCRALQSGEINGAQAAAGILFSDEYLARDTDDATYVSTLYRVFFSREPDEAGLEMWTASLESGASRYDVMMGFVNSVEWANVCAAAGIYSGSASDPEIEIVPSEDQIVFVRNMMSSFGSGNVTDGEIYAIAEELASLHTTGRQIAYDLIFGEGYTAVAKTSSPGRNVEIFYKAFYGREPFPAELNAMVRAMNGRINIDYLYDYFVNRCEFVTYCINRGIMPGRLIQVNTSGISDSAVRSFFDDAAFIGNSVTAGFPDYITNNPSALINGAEVYARVSYSFLTDQTERSGYMLTYEGTEMRAEDLLRLSGCGKAFICMGTNDLVGTPASTVLDRYISYLDGIRAKNPDMRILIVSTPPRCDSADNPRLTNENIDEFNSLLEEYCASEGLDFIDINTPLKNGTSSLYDDYSSDGFVHMNNAGYRVWTQTLTSYVRTALASQRHIYLYTGG